MDALAASVAAEIRDAVYPLLGTAAARARVGRAPAATRRCTSTRSPSACVEQTLAAAGDVGFYSEDRGLVIYGRPRALPRGRSRRRHPPGGRGPRVVLCVGRRGAAVGGRPARRGVVRRRPRAEDRRALPRARAATACAARPRPASPIPIAPSANTDLGALFWTAGLRGRAVAADERRARGARRRLQHGRRLLRSRVRRVQPHPPRHRSARRLRRRRAPDRRRGPVHRGRVPAGGGGLGVHELPLRRRRRRR